MESSPASNNGDVTAELEDQSSTIEVVENIDATPTSSTPVVLPAAPKPIVPPNGGFGWVVVGASFVIHVVVVGLLYSFGVFLVPFSVEFDVGRGTVAWIASMGGGLLTGIAFFSGRLADIYGNRLIIASGSVFVGGGFFLASFVSEVWQLFLSLGLVVGIGFGLTFVPAVSIVAQWFTTRRGMATGVAVSGAGIGQFVFSPFIAYLLTEYGWRSCLRILGIISFGGIISTLYFFRRLSPPLSKSVGFKIDTSFFHIKSFNILFFGTLIGTLGYMVPFSHLPAYSKGVGLTRSQASLELAVMGIASACGRLFSGVAADKFGRVPSLTLTTLLGSITLSLWPLCDDFNSIATFAVFFGFLAGGFISLLPTVAAELFGLEKLGSVLGLVYSSSAVGNLLAGPVAGWIFDVQGSYTLAIEMAAMYQFVAFTFFAFLIVEQHKVKLEQKERERELQQELEFSVRVASKIEAAFKEGVTDNGYEDSPVTPVAASGRV
eukprot:GILI01003683.1.p1 GENE.GILI01003683.1~~GILI01003683.1.p1  ORF type:complete len:491 (+),score=119.33 GILI01003683.1:226-1698(+)